MATGFSTLIQYFQTYGVLDFLLPFVLVFTIIFAVSRKLPLFKDHKNFQIIIALVLALVFVVPHISGTYPLGYDPVKVMNESLPSISLVAVASIMLLLLMGLFGTEFSDKAAPLVAVLAIGFVAYIFGSSLGFWTGPYDAFSWWSAEITELIIILLVFGVIVFFITKDEGQASATRTFEKLGKGIGDMFQKQK
jgi:hypothetical protein